MSPPPRSRRFGGGIPLKQYQLILRDGVHMSAYAARTFDGVAQATHLRRDNYFYYNCLTGVYVCKGGGLGGPGVEEFLDVSTLQYCSSAGALPRARQAAAGRPALGCPNAAARACPRPCRQVCARQLPRLPHPWGLPQAQGGGRPGGADHCQRLLPAHLAGEAVHQGGSWLGAPRQRQRLSVHGEAA